MTHGQKPINGGGLVYHANPSAKRKAGRTAVALGIVAFALTWSVLADRPEAAPAPGAASLTNGRGAADRDSDVTPRRWQRSPVRIRVVTGEGVFLVYDAARPSDSRRKHPGFLAYWYDFETREVYVFGRLVLSKPDVGHALLNLDRNLWIDPATVAEGIHWVEEAIAEAWWEQQDDTTWHPATRASILELMGFEAPAEPGGVASPPEEPPAECCLITDPCCELMASIGPSHLSPPPPGTPAEALISLSLTTVQCCPGDGGPGGPWPPPDCSSNADCNDGNPCTTDTCVNGHCEHEPDPDPCCPCPDSCCNGACCDTECWAGNTVCCPQGKVCIPGDICCDPGDVVCGGQCCDGPCCQATGECCPAGGSCCNNVCCARPCCDATGGCCDGLCCEGTCCPTGTTCCGTFCCPPDTTCCNPEVGECCTADQTCCDNVCGHVGACCFFDTGSCTETTQHCCVSQGGTYLGADTVCLPADLCQAVCENCHAVSAVLYECFHFAGPALPCGTAACIENTINTATCDFFPHRLGPPNCNTRTLADDPWVVQEVRRLEDSSCANYWPGDFHVWMERFYGCGSECFEDNPIMTRCDTFGCEGAFDYTQRQYPKRACGCP